MDRFSQFALAYQHMADEQSRRWFEARLAYAVTGDQYCIFDNVKQDEPQFHGWDLVYLQTMMEQTHKSKLLLMGAGGDGRYTAYILQHSPLADNLKGFLDDDGQLQGTCVCGLPVFSPLDAPRYSDEHIIIIASRQYGRGMYECLTRAGVPQSALYVSAFGIFTAGYGHQYFDVFQPREHEVFVDAGCCDASTSLEFVQWCHGHYDKIYAFEGSQALAKECEAVFQREQVRDYQMIPKACWKETGMVGFSDDLQSVRGNSAHITGQAGDVPAASIDGILGGTIATFIKMDIEGAEYEALQGARNTIQKYHPRLAISIYHKPMDVLYIPSYLMQLHEGYRFYIRHYCSRRWETVLYAE